MLIKEIFEKGATGKAITLPGYHWSEKEIKSLNHAPLYFSDDKETWASPWVKGLKLYKFTAIMKNPYVMLKHPSTYEDPKTLKLEKTLQKAGYDGIIYTPGKNVFGSRQAIVFDAANQIKNLKRIK